MGKIKQALIDTPLEDVVVPEFVYENSKIEETINILRERGQNELADMLEKEIAE